MTAIARLTRAELRKLATTRAFAITLAISVALAVISVAVNAFTAGRNGTPALGTAASTYQMLKLGGVSSVAMLVLGIIASGGEYRHRTIIPATLITPRRGTQVAAKTIATAIAGVVLSGLTFGLGLATVVAELHARGIQYLPAATGRMFVGSVIASTLFGVIGVALGYLTRSTIAAVAGAVGWVLFAELAILRTLAPQLAKWLISGTAFTLTNPPASSAANLPPAIAAGVLGAYAVALLIAATQVVLRRDVT
jgi:ABC-type transport system involved in multi-copper enzyme maturation permease subunit